MYTKRTIAQYTYIICIIWLYIIQNNCLELTWATSNGSPLFLCCSNMFFSVVSTRSSLLQHETCYTGEYSEPGGHNPSNKEAILNTEQSATSIQHSILNRDCPIPSLSVTGIKMFYPKHRMICEWMPQLRGWLPNHSGRLHLFRHML